MFAGDFYTRPQKRTLQVIMVYELNTVNTLNAGDPHLYNEHTEPFNWALFHVLCISCPYNNIIPLVAIFDVINIITIVNNIDKS